MVAGVLRRDGPVALIGGSGFIGLAIARALTAIGRPVRIIDLVPPVVPLPEVTFHCCDIASPLSLTPKLQGCTDAVLLAGIMESASRANPQRSWETNVAGTVSSMHASINATVRRIVFLSSAMVYDVGASSSPLAETAPTVANSVYTAAKLSGEMALRAAALGRLCFGLALRPFSVFGPGPMDGNRGHFIGRWLTQVRSGQALSVYGTGDDVVDLVHVEVVAALVTRFLGDRDVPQFMILNATGGAPLTVAEIADCFLNQFPGLEVAKVAAPDATKRRGWGDPTAMREFLREDADRLEPPRAALTAFLSKTATGMDREE